MTTQAFSRNFEDQTPRIKALVTAIANVFHNGDVETTWAAIVAQPGPQDLRPLDESDGDAHVLLRLDPSKAP